MPEIESPAQITPSPENPVIIGLVIAYQWWMAVGWTGVWPFYNYKICLTIIKQNLLNISQVNFAPATTTFTGLQRNDLDNKGSRIGIEHCHLFHSSRPFGFYRSCCCSLLLRDSCIWIKWNADFGCSAKVLSGTFSLSPSRECQRDRLTGSPGFSI